MGNKKGFTVVELLITMAIIGILTAIAFPSYQSHVRKGSRAAAQAAMIQVADREAQYLLDARNYALGSSALTTLNVTLPTDVSTMYTITVTAADGTSTPSTPRPAVKGRMSVVIGLSNGPPASAAGTTVSCWRV